MMLTHHMPEQPVVMNYCHQGEPIQHKLYLKPLILVAQSLHQQSLVTFFIGTFGICCTLCFVLWPPDMIT